MYSYIQSFKFLQMQIMQLMLTMWDQDVANVWALWSGLWIFKNVARPKNVIHIFELYHNSKPVFVPIKLHFLFWIILSTNHCSWSSIVRTICEEGCVFDCEEFCVRCRQIVWTSTCQALLSVYNGRLFEELYHFSSVLTVSSQGRWLDT